MSSPILLVAVLTMLLWTAVRIRRIQPPELKKFFWPALIFKIIAGLSLGYIYFIYYGSGDTINYWLDGKIIAERILQDPINTLRILWEDDTNQNLAGLINNKPRSVFFVKIAGLIALLTDGNYVLMSIFISYVSFLASWYAFRKLVSRFPDARRAAAVAFLFFPSVVFWSSGLIKESLGLASLYILTGFFLTIYGQKKIKGWEWILATLFFWIGWNLKYYWIGIFIPVVLTTLIIARLVKGRENLRRLETALWFGLFIIFLFAATSLHPNFYPNRIVDVIWESNQEFMNLAAPGNVVHYNHLQPDFFAMATNAPGALLAGIFRPYCWESHNLFSAMAAIENTIVLLLVISAATAIRKFFVSPHRILSLAIILYTVLLAIFLALSTPNLGTLSRYKIGFLPFLVFLILYHNPAFAWLERRLPLGHKSDSGKTGNES